MGEVMLELRCEHLKGIAEEVDNVLRFKSFIAGEWVSGEEFIRVKSPINGEVFAEVPKLRYEVLDEGIEGMFREGRWLIRDLPGDSRLKILARLADLMSECFEDFVNALIINAGKTRAQAEGEVRACIDRLGSASLDVRKLVGDYIPGDWSSHTLGSEAVVRREPYGIVLAIVPFNYPLFDTVNKFTYSMLAGNAVIIKPPSSVPIPTVMFARLALKAGMPGKSLTIATIPGRESGALVRDSRISVISLTGSTETGLRVLREAGIKQFIMELGGGDPAIVLSDADVELAADNIVKGMTGYSGQRCDAIKLILAEDGVYGELRNELVRRLSRIRVGDPRVEGVDMGPLIDSKAVDYMVKAVEEAVGKGCRLLYGGRRLGPTYVEPALLEAPDKEVLKDLTLYKEEVFAPVAIMLRVNSIDEAIEVANGRRYGLDAAIFGRDINKIRKLIRYLEVGAVYINEYPRHGIGYYPFGGRKDSGIGREGVGYSIEYVTAYKTIIYNYRGRGVWSYT